MKKFKIRTYIKNKQAHAELLESRNFLGIHWWSITLHRSGTMIDITHYVHAWCVNFGLDAEKDVEELT